MLNVIAITVSKMASHCVDTVQIREESERGMLTLIRWQIQKK